MDKRKVIRQVKRKGFLKVGGCKVCGSPSEWVYWENVLVDFTVLTVELSFYCDVHKPIEV